jgi:hypothetical protein
MITGTKTAIVLAIGVVKPHTGETGHGWNMYDSWYAGETGFVTLTDGFLMYHSNADDFTVGEDIVLQGNDSGRKLKTTRIRAQAPAERDAVLKMLLDNGYDYYPTRAFRKKRFSRKLTTSYSVKGITIE